MQQLAIPYKSSSDFYGQRIAWDLIRSAAGLLEENRPCGTFDLSAVLHVKPYVVAIIAAMAKRNQLLGTSADYVEPTNQKAKEHLGRLGLPELLGSGTSIEVARRSTNLPIQLLQGLPAESVGWEAAELLEKELGCQLPAGTKPGITDCINEMVGNAAAHSGSKIGCVVVGQAFPASSRIDVAILDLGITIRGHLSMREEYSDLADDGEAILLAMQDGVTGVKGRDRFGETHSGAGLSELQRFVGNCGGAVAILSGSAIVCTDGSQPTKTHRLHGPPFRGTLVNISFPTSPGFLTSVATESVADL